jgi:NADH-quinone oxidoreductase subunit F
MYKTIKRIKTGGGRLEDLDILLNMANNMGIMPGTTICGLADGAAWPIKNALTKFRDEFEDYIKTHQGGPRVVTPLQERIAHGLPADPSDTPLLPILTGPGSALRSPHAD